VGTWVVAFVVSFFPIYAPFEAAPSVWTSGIDWVLSIGLPTIAVFLIVLRRLSPQGIRRVGSLGIDQFASVAFSVATVFWLSILWQSFVRLADGGQFFASWVVWVEFFLMLAGVALTAFAPLIPPFAQDFRGRPEVPAHRNARPVRPVATRPAPVRPEPAAATPAVADSDDAAHGEPDAPSAAYVPAAGEGETEVIGAERVSDTPAADARADDDFITKTMPVDERELDTVAADEILPAEDGAATAPEKARESFEHVENPPSTVEPAAASAPQHQAFWALVPEERDIVDEIGIPVFRIGPTAWALVIEDRGDVFVVRHEDGRIGYLHDVSGVTRG
jgi:hypothetical protein